MFMHSIFPSISPYTTIVAIVKRFPVVTLSTITNREIAADISALQHNDFSYFSYFLATCELRCFDEYDPSLSCQCNKRCVEFGNCCDDYHDECLTGKTTRPVKGLSLFLIFLRSIETLPLRWPSG